MNELTAQGVDASMPAPGSWYRARVEADLREREALLRATENAPGGRWRSAGDDPIARARLIWGTAHIREAQDVICIGPIGSRDDWLLCWRRGKRVSTGMLGDDRPCFEGSLEEFSARVEAEYGARLVEDEVLQSASSEYRARLRKVGDDYRRAITFLTHLLAVEVSR